MRNIAAKIAEYFYLNPFALMCVEVMIALNV